MALSMTENWRDIPGFEGRYMVSDLGRVRSLLRKTGVMRQYLDADGYLLVTLTGAKSATLPKRVHLLVLRAFVGPKLPGFVTRHVNGICSDNRLSNLLYGTPKENTADRLRHGTYQFGEQNPKARLSFADVKFIRAQPYQRGLYTQLAQRFKVSRPTITSVIRRNTWYLH